MRRQARTLAMVGHGLNSLQYQKRTRLHFSGSSGSIEASPTVTPSPVQNSFLDLKTRPDPKPKWRLSVRNLMLAATGFLGFWYGEAGVNQLHQRAATHTTQVQTVSGQSPLDQTLKALAKVDHTVQNTPILGTAQNWYVKLLTWELFSLGLVASGLVVKRRINPSKLFEELNKRGLTGKNIKVGIIDTGNSHTGHIHRNNMTFYSPKDVNTPIKPFDSGGHGTAVTEIIASACPEAEFIGIPVATAEEFTQIDRHINALYEKAKTDPDTLTLNNLRQAFAPLLTNMASALRKQVDAGCQVVNVSLSLEQGVMIKNMMKLLGALPFMGFHFLKRWCLPKNSEAFARNQDKGGQLIDYMSQITKLIESQTWSLNASPELLTLYKPWQEALDYAHSKNVAVVVAAGNSGGHTAGVRREDKNVLGNVNPLAMIGHPALITVGSTNSEGVISTFTSEFNDTVQPTIAAIGSGELSTRGKAMKRPWWKKLIFPLGTNPSLISPYQGLLGRLKMNQPQGTSFAAPNVTSLYVKMKQLDPSLTPEEAKGIFKAAATQARFSNKDLKKITQEVEGALDALSLEEMEDSLRGPVTKLFLTAVGGKEGPTEVTLSVGHLKIELVPTGDFKQWQFVFQGNRPNSKRHELALTLTEDDTERLKYLLSEGKRIEAVLENPSDSNLEAVLPDPVYTVSPEEKKWVQEISETCSRELTRTINTLALCETVDEQKRLKSKQFTAEDNRKIQELLQKEITRRVGAGTLAGRHHLAIALTEEKKREKELTNARPVAKTSEPKPLVSAGVGS